MSKKYQLANSYKNPAKIKKVSAKPAENLAKTTKVSAKSIS